MDQHQKERNLHAGGNPARGASQVPAPDPGTPRPCHAPHPAGGESSSAHTPRQTSEEDSCRIRQPAIAHSPNKRRSIAARMARKLKTKEERSKWRKEWPQCNHPRIMTWGQSLGSTAKEGGKEATFTALAQAFGVNDEVTDLFLQSPMENLQDLRYYFIEGGEIGEFVATTLGTEFSDSSNWQRFSG